MNPDTERELTHLRDRIEEIGLTHCPDDNERRLLAEATFTIDEAIEHARSARNVEHALGQIFTHAPIACAGFCNPQVSPSHWRATPDTQEAPR
jgi:hypothetical protein